jgi:hypothetical protein
MLTIDSDAYNVFWAPDGLKFITGGESKIRYFNYNRGSDSINLLDF